MLSYIELKNFKSLTDVKIDLRGENKKPKKMIFIYGENGAGKTNLISSILFLEKSLLTLSNNIKLRKIYDKNVPELLSDIENDEIKKEVLDHIIKDSFFDMRSLIQENKTINSEGNMEVKIGFNINGLEGSYELKFDDESVIFEELKYLVNERVGRLFKIDANNIIISPSMITTPSYKKELKDNIEKYWGKNTFMSIIFNEIQIKNNDFINNSLSPNLIDVFNWMKKISLQCKNAKSSIGRMAIPTKILSNLEEGTITEKNNKELLSMEKFLNEVFTQLYSDVKKVFYVFTPIDNKFRYELYFSKLIDDDVKSIPFNLESTGTQQLLDVIKFIFLAILGNTVIIDEMENGIHDLLIYEVISSLFDAFNSIENVQFIATTHSTYLMEMLPQENIYILVSDALGRKSILPIDNFDFRTQKNNNIRLKYLRGDYSGIPNVGYLDFNELVDQFREDLK